MPRCHRFQKATSRRFTRLRKEERGQSMVEFAIVLPVLLMIIVGILYFGRFEDYSNQTTQLAEQGARMAAVNATTPTGYASLQDYLEQQAQPELANSSSDVVTKVQVYIYQPSSESSVWSVGKLERVCVIFQMTFAPIIGVPKTTVAHAATMRIEQAPASNQNPYTAGNTPLLPYTGGTPNATVPSQCSQL